MLCLGIGKGDFFAPDVTCLSDLTQLGLDKMLSGEKGVRVIPYLK